MRQEWTQSLRQLVALTSTYDAGSDSRGCASITSMRARIAAVDVDSSLSSDLKVCARDGWRKAKPEGVQQSCEAHLRAAHVRLVHRIDPGALLCLQVDTLGISGGCGGQESKQWSALTAQPTSVRRAGALESPRALKALEDAMCYNAREIMQWS